MHGSTGQKKILSDLASGLTTPHHQDWSRWQCIRVAVIPCIKLKDRAWEPFRQGMPPWLVVTPGGHNDLLRLDLSFTGDQAVAMTIRRQPLHGNALSHIPRHMSGKPLQEVHDRVFVHEPLRLVAVVREVR